MTPKEMEAALPRLERIYRGLRKKINKLKLKIRHSSPYYRDESRNLVLDTEKAKIRYTFGNQLRKVSRKFSICHSELEKIYLKLGISNSFQIWNKKWIKKY